MGDFHFDATFGEDYLHFYLPHLTDERSDAEVTEITETLGLKPGDRVLDAPCGHGRIANRLARAGIDVIGVDATAIFLEKAEAGAAEMGVSVGYVHGDMRKLPVGGPFDAVLCWFTSFGYFPDDENRLVLREYRRVLRDGGRLLIETMHRDGVLQVLSPATVTRVGDDLMIDESSFDSMTGRIVTGRTVVRDGTVRRSQHFVRLPTVTEFRLWLEEAGFSTVDFSDRGGKPLTMNSRRLMVVATA